MISTIHHTGAPRHTETGRGPSFLQPKPSLVFSPGELVVRRVGSMLAELVSASAPRSDLILMGTFVGTYDYTAPSTSDDGGGAVDADGSKSSIAVAPLSASGTGWFSTGTGAHKITAAHVDKPAFMYDGDTYYADDMDGTLSFGGWVAGVDSNTGKVLIKHSEQLRQLFELYNLGNATAGETEDLYARAVATSLPAGTFSGGVLTLTATGAFSTAQDGVTLEVGDIVNLPLGTITTLTVSAANSGPYQVTSLGATGVSATFARPAKWAHGATIKPGSCVRVGGEGTLFRGSRWFADPATADKVVGTDDPILYPEKVTQSVTLSSSAAAVANVPIRSATKSHVVASLVTAGGTTTSTVGYGIVAAPTPGGIGTATTTVNALASGGGKNGTADQSVLAVTIFN